MTRQPNSPIAQKAYEFIKAHPDGVSYYEIARHLGMQNTKGMTSFMATLMSYPKIYTEGNKLFAVQDGDEDL